ncbi:MAG TPA: glycogen-binding domain-containing protein [Candidatus Binatia bacterium]|nr:glycogen-binding domain-containing protein [Candidatus Binatia bacterium]
MSKKAIARTKKPLSPKPATRQDDTAYLVREDLDEEQERLKEAAAAGAGALKTPAPAETIEPPPAPATVPAKPLAPLAALWPSAVSPGEEVKPSPAPVPQAPKAPVAAVAPKAPPTLQGKSAVPAQAPKPAAQRPVNVTFVLVKPDAKRVSICGEFNGWSSSATTMKRHADGHWEATVALAPGRYQYKFVVDGEWILDPSAQKSVPNQQGSLNSVLEVRAR